MLITTSEQARNEPDMNPESPETLSHSHRQELVNFFRVLAVHKRGKLKNTLS